MFSFPNDEDTRKAWARAIPRENFVPSIYSKVCERHFSPDDILREASYIDDSTGRTVTAPLSRLRLRPEAVPSIFPKLPEYISKERRREDPVAKRQRLDASALQRALQESIVTAQKEREADSIDSVKKLAEFVRNECPTFWNVIENNEHVLIAHIVGDESPWIKYSVVVKSDLTITLNLAKTAVERLGRHLTPPCIANSKREVIEFLDGIQRFDSDIGTCSETSEEEIYATVITLLSKIPQAKDTAQSLQLLIEQVKLLSSKRDRRYSADFMIVCCLLHIISPNAYRYLCSHGSIILPSQWTIQSICFSIGMSPELDQQNGSFLRYMARRISALVDIQRNVILTVDEINIKPFFDCQEKNNDEVGLASSEAASSAFVFMVESLACSFKEVAHVSPVHRVNGESLHRLMRSVICGLEDIGYRVVCVVTSNSPVNRKAMLSFKSSKTMASDLAPQKTPTNDFVFPHPCDSQRPLFFLIDPVHILKRVRNTWLKQNDQCFLFPEFEPNVNGQRRLLCASFNAIKNAYDLESDLLVQYGYALSKAAVSSTDVEKQNVQVALEIFNHSGPIALCAVGEKHDIEHYKETTIFIEIVAKWWTIVSMKTPSEGLRLRDEFQNAGFPPPNNHEVAFLYSFLDWLEEWSDDKANACKLSKTTHHALHQTTRALLEIARYCFDLKMSEVLLGKFQTDLEDRFGRCRHKAPVS